jgi:DNA-binding transcriptional MerR regulator
LIIKLILPDQFLAAASGANVGNTTKGTLRGVSARGFNIGCSFLLDPGIDSRVHTSPMRDKPRGLRSGELARAAGVSTDTLRHYERLGVLAEAPRSPSGYRVYPAESLERVKMVRHALRLGFTLAELAEILRARNRGGVPCKQVLGMLEEKVGALGHQISDLKRLEKYMEQIVGDWRSKVGQSEPGKRAHLLQSLMAAPAPGATNRSLQRRAKQR